MHKDNKDKTLDLLFAEARQEKAPVESKKIQNLLQHKNPSKSVQFFKPKTIFMTASVLVTFSLLLYFSNPEKEQATVSTKINEKANHETVIKLFEDKNILSENSTKPVSKSARLPVAKQNNADFPYSDTSKNASLYQANDSLLKSLITNQTLTNNQPEANDLQSVTPTPTQVIELPEEILNKLNITFSRNGICVGVKGETIYTCYDMKGSMTIFPNKFFKGKLVKQEDGSVRVDVNPEFTANRDSLGRLQPMLITDDGGKHWRSMHFSDKTAKEMVELYPELDNMPTTKEQTEIRINLQWKYINSKLNTLVPVLVKMPKPYRKKRQPRKNEMSQDVIMWFEPTNEFLAVLSDTLRKIIVSEISENQTTNTSALHIENITVNEEVNSFKLSVYPNPVIDKATINFQLEKDKKVNIALHDISGKLVTIFVRNELKSRGNNSIEIDLKDLIQGVYILSIETADGNILTQRVIKQ